MWRHTPMATISGNQNVAVAHASTTKPSTNGASRVDARRRVGGEQQVGAGEHGDGDGAGGDPRRRVGLGRLERLERPAQEHHRHDDQVEDEAERERGRGR